MSTKPTPHAPADSPAPRRFDSTPDLGKAQRQYGDLLAGIPEEECLALLTRFATLRRGSDRLLLRTSLFDALAHHLGQAVATARLLELDQRLPQKPARP